MDMVERVTWAVCPILRAALALLLLALIADNVLLPAVTRGATHVIVDNNLMATTSIGILIHGVSIDESKP